jgi:hypothetical protein
MSDAAKLAEWRAKAAEKREGSRAEKDARNDAQELELYEKFGVEIEDMVWVRLPDAPMSVVGHVVCDALPRAQYSRYMSIVNRGDKPGAAEAKARFFDEIVVQTLKWPSREQYDALIKAPGCAFVVDEIAGALIKHAKAGADKAAK